MRATHTVEQLNAESQSRLIEMAWEDRTPFEAIEHQFGLAEQDVIRFMRAQLKPKSFRNWRARVSGRATKHSHLRSSEVLRGYAKAQYKPKHGQK
ncbi:TIGR03643 family protein [Marinomonas ostreistagni]|uniref:TIGR03643 family protein n=1 Tax=Marinomonas ostreistagni TaxID=359209 RepID=UPI00194F3759|nr:TIGR03643 family protein [Marinomonas ostreistagni]MBM6552099.1 TIGR03643 family protein [Marinomonas ostreistagni]